MNRPTRSIIVVGGGTAGWITAGRIAAKHAKRGIQVTLVESPDTPTVGVGEGTWPTMRTTLLELGISETRFLRECNATFKQGAKFARWKDGGDADFYYHPLTLPQGFTKGNAVPWWQTTREKSGSSFASALCFQQAICEQGLAPKTIRTPEFQSVANYAYHLDAGKFTQLLQQHCTETLGVTHIRDHVVDVQSREDGDIDCLLTRASGSIPGDLFVDCSGFSSRLLGQHLDVPFIDCSDVLFIDNALAVQISYSDKEPIASHTVATAQTAGWIWDIGLQQRRGIGHVYSSRHQSEAEAEKALRAYIGPQMGDAEIRKIAIKSGCRRQVWKNNCVAVGLSAGFLEPLEASSLVLVELSAAMLAEQLPASRDVMDIIAKRFNTTFRYRWDRIIDFLKLHYCISKREDSQFWLDNRDPATIPESLQELLQLWRYQSPGDHDFTSNNEVFPAASYQYVLYGMGFESEYLRATEQDLQFGEEQFQKNRKMTAQALAGLPTNRELLDKIHEFGLQRV
jgi:tryptophan halogenase